MMKIINKLFVKKAIIPIIAFFSLFSFNMNVNAKVTMTSIKPPLNKFTVAKDYYSVRYYAKIGSKKLERWMDPYIYAVDEGNGKIRHAYCVQPGIHAGVWSKSSDKTYNGNIISKEDYLTNKDSSISKKQEIFNQKKLSNGDWYGFINSTQKEMIFQVLNYAKEYDASSSLSSFATNVSNMSEADYQTIMAAQGIIWEIVTGERTNFDTIAPNKKISNDFYDALIKYSGNQKGLPFNTAITQYEHIINKVYNAYYRIPGSNYAFKTTKESANKYEIKINSSIDIKDNKSAFQYFEIERATDGLKAEIVNNDTIRVTATKAFTQDNPAELTLVTKSSKTESDKTGNKIIITNFYASEDSQDFAYGSPTPKRVHIKFYTPKYKLEIIKLDEDKKGLAGAKFNLCSDNKCNDIIAELKSGEDGKVTYEVEKTGTYYVKEIEAPEGYVLDSKIRSITVSDSNSNPKPIEFENKARSMNLTKRTVDENGNVTILEDGCGTDTYTGPKFEIKNKDGKTLYFEEIEEGLYKPSDEENGKIEIKTCNGAFSVKYMTECEYEIVEREAPEGLMLPDNPALKVNICKSDGNISFTNGFTGLEFQKKDESGNLISGGKFALQKKENGAYKDVLLKKVKEGYYTYDSKLTEDDADVSYIMETDGGISFIDKISTGEYRVVEKEAPEGYEPIKDKDSTAKIVIKDDSSNSYNRVELINKKISVGGDDASAELIVTITTGRKVLNYVLIFGGLASILIVLIILRKKFKK